MATNSPLLVALAPSSVPGPSETHALQLVVDLVGAQFGLSAAGLDSSHLVDPTTGTRVSARLARSLGAPPRVSDIAFGISAAELDQRDVAAIYVMGYYAPSKHAMVLYGYITLSDLLAANRHRVVKRPPTRANERPPVEWLTEYTCTYGDLRPLAELDIYLRALRAGTSAWASNAPATPTRQNGLDVRQLFARSLSDEVVAAAQQHAEERERAKRSSPETLHKTPAGNFGSHEQGYIAEIIVGDDLGLIPDTRVLAGGDGGRDFFIPRCAMSLDAKGTGNDWRYKPTDIRVKAEHVKWGITSQIYIYLSISKQARRVEVLGWATLDEVMRHAEPTRLSPDPSYPINYLFPVGKLRPPATLRAVVGAFDASLAQTLEPLTPCVTQLMLDPALVVMDTARAVA
jgi:hypothetical protein